MALDQRKELLRLVGKRPTPGLMDNAPLWTFTKQLNGLWHLELLGGTRCARVTLQEEEFSALLAAAAGAAWARAHGEDVSDFPLIL